MKVFSLKFSFIILALLLLCGCNHDRRYNADRVSGVIWGTTYNITYNGTKSKHVDIDAEINRALSGVDSIANVFDTTSVTARFNREKEALRPPEKFLKLLEITEKIYQWSDGAFDPTVGPLVNLWGYGTTRSTGTPPTQELDSVLSEIGFAKISFNSEKVSATNSTLALDFGAIAKGYGVDCVAEALKSAGIHDFMVEIGGEVRVAGHNPRGQSWWNIQIDAPVPDLSGAHNKLTVIELHDASVATSGNYRNFGYTADGLLTYHTISPLTGRPIQTEILSSTIVAESTALADGLATACMVMGLTDASRMITRLAADKATGVYGAVFVTASADKNSQYEIYSIALDENKVRLRSE